MINPYMPRDLKLKETVNVIRRIQELTKWADCDDRSIITGNYTQPGGWQWVIAAELYCKYASVMDAIFHEKKITDLTGNTLKAYGPAEMSEMVKDIEEREKRDNKRKRAVYVSLKSAPSAEDLETLRTDALAATVAVQKTVLAYTGSKQFKRPKKKKNPLQPSVEINCKANDGKFGKYWRVPIWILFSDEHLANVQQSVMCWQLPGHPTIFPQKPGAQNSEKRREKEFSKKTMAAWNTYSSTPQAELKPKAKAKSKGKAKAKGAQLDFGQAAEESSYSVASSSSGRKHKKSKNKKAASMEDLEEGATEAIAASTLIAERLTAMEHQLTASKAEMVGLARAEVTNRFKQFETIMQQFALEMSRIQDVLATQAVAASEVVEALRPKDCTQEERQALEKQKF